MAGLWSIGAIRMRAGGRQPKAPCGLAVLWQSKMGRATYLRLDNFGEVIGSQITWGNSK